MDSDDPITFALSGELSAMSNPDLITTWATIFIAAMGVIIAVTVAVAARKHNRLSFRPLVYCGIDSNMRGTSITVANAGTGPAKIKKFSLNWGEAEPEFDSPQQLSNFFFRELSLPNGEVYYKIIRTGFVLAVGDEIVIIGLSTKKDEATEQEYTAWLSALASFKVHVEYESIYGERFTCDKGST